MIAVALGKLVRWVVRRAGATNLLLLTLILLAVASTASGVADRVRGVDPALALTLAILGLLCGWLVSLTPLSVRWAALVMGTLGLVVVLVRVGRLGGELLGLARSWNRLLFGLPAWAMEGATLNWHPVWQALARLGEAAGTLLTRVHAWGVALVTGAPTFDPVAVSFVWGLGLWAAAGWAGWLLCRRERPMVALLPCGVLMLTAFSNVWGSHVFLLGLLLAGFLLMALISYDRRMHRWQTTSVDYPELRPQTIAVTLFLSLGLVTVAATVPALQIDRVLDLAPLVSGERSDAAEAVADSLGMEQRERTEFREVRTTGLPREHLLGAGPELSERVVMIVSTEDRPPGTPQEATGSEPTRYYWRSHTYDRYTGRGWTTDEAVVVSYEAGVPAITATLTTQRVVRQEVRWLSRGDPLAHAAGTLMVADHDYTVAWRSPEDPFAVTIRAKSYRADSFVPMVTERGLREYRGNYPAWVRERYLPLPEDVPARVLVLARDLTATAGTPYDRARAIETHLRALPYTLDVPKPPPGRGAVDYFLFDLREGYCGYYASAMVVLARAAGLPARLAIGYASGSYNANEAQYVVTEADAHAWPEIYFPAYGWVRFEPTAGRRPVVYAAESEAGWTEPEGALEPAGGVWRGLPRAWWQVLLGSVALLGLVAMTWHGLDWWRLRRQEPRATVASLYRRLQRFGRRLDVPMAAGDTPREFGTALAGCMRGWSGGRPRTAPTETWAQRVGWGRISALVAAGAGEVVWLTDLYGRVSYSPHSPGAAERMQALRVWASLQWRLRLAQLVRKLGFARTAALG